MPDPKKKAKTLMNRSEKLKKMAAEQEKLGKAQIKNKVKQGTMVYNGNVLPVGKERLDIARKMRAQATEDSLKSVKYSQMGPSKRRR